MSPAMCFITHMLHQAKLIKEVVKFHRVSIICLVNVNTVVPVMNGHLGTRQKCPYMTGGRSSQGRVGGAKRNRPTLYTTTSPPAILILNTMSCIVMYAIVIEPKINAS